MFGMSEQKNLTRTFFIGLLIATTLLFFRMVQSFFVPVILAAVFATLFYPLFEAFVRVFRGRRSLAAFFCCIVLLLGLILPLLGVANMVAGEAVSFYHLAQTKLTEIQQSGQPTPLAWARNLPLVRQLQLDRLDWREGLQNLASQAGPIVATVINKTSRGTLQIIVLLFTTLFTMFYFFRDGRRLLSRLRFLVPLDRAHKNAIASRFTSVARATVKGTLLIAVAQGTLSGLTLWAFGVGSPFLWGVVATFLSIIPLVGAWLVLYPAAFFQMATGHLWQGIGILIVTVVVIVNVDNLMRPRLVGQEAGMHDLMVFFSTLGGIGMFGATGFIIGPMIAALFLSLLDIYSAEYVDHLDGALPPSARPFVLEPAPAAPAAEQAQTPV
jgi:predicted PurR-regulated permease PerM